MSEDAARSKHAVLVPVEASAFLGLVFLGDDTFRWVSLIRGLGADLERPLERVLVERFVLLFVEIPTTGSVRTRLRFKPVAAELALLRLLRVAASGLARDAVAFN